MPDRDTPSAAGADLRSALVLLTRLPVAGDAERGARAAWAWPLAGLVVALVTGAVCWLAIGAGLPAPVAAGLGLAAQIAITGALHEDGLADSADGLWGGWDRQRRLEIMKDSRIGTYGVIALILSLGLRWSALSVLFAQGMIFVPLIAAAMMSRAAMIWLMRILPNARGGGLSSRTGTPDSAGAWAATGLAGLPAVLLAGSAAAAAAIAALGTTLAAIRIARAKIGGQTGDILGATQQLAEIAVLAALAGLAMG